MALSFWEEKEEEEKKALKIGAVAHRLLTVLSGCIA